jgi:hypothetical protein
LSPSGRYPDGYQLFHRRTAGDHDFVPLGGGSIGNMVPSNSFDAMAATGFS